MFERDLPGENTKGYSGESKVGQLPLATCATMNGAWGFNLVDKKFKDRKTLLHYLIKAAGYNANFLLNNGPMPNGKMQSEVISMLKEMGAFGLMNMERQFMKPEEDQLSLKNGSINKKRKQSIPPHSRLSRR